MKPNFIIMPNITVYYGICGAYSKKYDFCISQNVYRIVFGKLIVLYGFN